MHPCGHSSIKFCGYVTLGLKIHFSYLSQPSVSKTSSFINSCIHPSFFWVFKKISRHSPFRCTHTFFPKKITCVLIGKFFQRKTDSYFFSKSCWLFSQFFYEVFCEVFLLPKLYTCISKVFLLPKHTYIYFVRYFCYLNYIHAYLRYFGYLNTQIYFVRYF